MKKVILARTAALSLALAALSACSTSPVPAVSAPAASTSTAARYDYVLTVAARPGDTVGGLEGRYGGKVVVLDSAAGYATLGLSKLQAASLRSGVGPAGVLPLGAADGLEPNRDVFSGGGSVSAWAGGSVSAWAGGSVSAWAGGSVSAWAGGNYTALPGNNTAWQLIKLQAAQTRAPKLGDGVKVAIIDTGIDLTHPAFQGSLAPAAEMKDFVDGDAVPQEVGSWGVGAYGHGTNVAGIVLQIAPRATILPLRVLNSDGSGDVANVAAAIYYAVDKGAKVINLSLGSTERVDAINYALVSAIQRGVLITASAGNGGSNQLTFPAADAASDTDLARYGVSVGSVSATRAKSWFSNYNQALEICGPGEVVYGPAPGGMTTAWSGTSMAAPMVAGGFALSLGQGLKVSLADVAKKLIEDGTDVYNVSLNDPFKDNKQLGVKGLINLDKFISDTARP